MSEIKNVILCQKICLYDKKTKSILLCKRQGEEDFDEVFSFPGGKMDDADETMVDGIKRELEEELGSEVEYELQMDFSINREFTRKDGKYMVLPHYLAIYKGGKIHINEDEYSDSIWVTVEDMSSVNCIPNIKEISDLLISKNTKTVNLTDKESIERKMSTEYKDKLRRENIEHSIYDAQNKTLTIQADYWDTENMQSRALAEYPNWNEEQQGRLEKVLFQLEQQGYQHLVDKRFENNSDRLEALVVDLR